MPNWAFSVPLARLRLAAAAEKEQQEEEKRRKKEKRKEKERGEQRSKSSKKKENGGDDEKAKAASSPPPLDFERERAQAKAGLVRAASLYPLAVVRLCARLAEAGAGRVCASVGGLLDHVARHTQTHTGA